jgi:hypothetical protein
MEGIMETTRRFKYALLVLIAICIVNLNMGFAKPVDDKIKDFIDDAADSLKGAVDKFGDDLMAIQKYLENYHWKGLIQDEATAGPTTLKHLHLNGHPRVIVARPGERISAFVQCNLDRDKCSALSLYRVVLGIKGQGAQTTIGNDFGLAAGESLENFVLIAPATPGVYQIRFRTVESLLEAPALKAWLDDKGNEPDGTTTVGIIYVK